MADFEETVKIARTNPKLKLMVSIGGLETYSALFSPSLANSTKKALFIRNIVEFMNESGVDGVNIWWEPTTVSQEDKINFAIFIKELRAAFDGFPRKLVISIVATKHPDIIRTNYLFNIMANYTDFIHSLTYGYYSPRSSEKFTGPLAPIFKSRPFERNEYLHQTMKELACGAGNPNEVNLGIGFYAWHFGHASKTKLWEMDEMWRMVDKGTIFESKKINYREVKNFYNLSEFKFHDLAKTVYHYDSNEKIFIGAENLRSIKLKLEYASEFGLGGIMISNIDHDDDEDNLLNFISQEWIQKCNNQIIKRQNYLCDADSLDQLTNPVIFPLKTEWLSNQAECCQRIEDMDGEIPFNCSKLKRGLSPASKNNGHNDGNYHQFFRECILANSTHLECCRRKNVSPECLPLCNGTLQFGFDEMNSLIALNCSIHAQEIAAQCALEIYESKKVVIMVAHGSSIVIVVFVAVCLVILNKCRQKINRRKKANLNAKLQIKENAIGNGKFGQVFEAKWQGKQVAVKKLKVDENFELKREFHLLKRLEHPNLCRTLGYVTIDKKLAILMEFAEFGDLQNFLFNYNPFFYAQKEKRKFVLDTGKLIGISSMIASGLKYLFSKNIIHRDLAARNCLVFRSNVNNNSAIKFGHLTGIVVKISDFGLARILERDRNAYYASYAWIWKCFGIGIGPNAFAVKYEKMNEDGESSQNSPKTEENNAENADTTSLLCAPMPIDFIKIGPYMPSMIAPECLDNRKYTFQSDIWSFGMLLIELFKYGKMPYANERGEIPSTKTIMEKIHGGILPEFPNNMPSKIANLISECCQIDPKMRVGISEICNQLEALKNEESGGFIETTL